jgi:hypothetical protein
MRDMPIVWKYFLNFFMDCVTFIMKRKVPSSVQLFLISFRRVYRLVTTLYYCWGYVESIEL